MRTEARPGSGVGTSTTSATASGPGRRTTTARMSFPSCPLEPKPLYYPSGSSYPEVRNGQRGEQMPTSTAAQRRDREKQRYDAYLAECPARQLLDRISDKWVSLVLNALADGPLRYAELARIIAGVSPKMLTQTLRGLERDGLIERRITAAVPVRVDYELTELGRSLGPVMAAIKGWAEARMDDVLAARHEYDQRR
ncbi:hypothetical protein F5544_00885 [Nocardia arthritidis]|uniref:HTH hxlR-type domain-containing protein n=2 Tax=Nocardia arthritidis TaxID=228602 RepID=A0A6G9Y4I2_9NOCA|nr:hypothetical protein F5544_00885 [Nocardia arthritidis]